MFSYLDGFDNICAKVTPMEVVTLVNKMFLTFDQLCEKNDVYKVRDMICVITQEFRHLFFSEILLPKNRLQEYTVVVIFPQVKEMTGRFQKNY